MSKEIVKNFNLILESFLSQITPLVGSFYIKKFQLIIKCNSTLPIEKFLVHALPLRDKILNRDESYFNNNDNHNNHNKIFHKISMLHNGVNHSLSLLTHSCNKFV